jgi:predicted RNA-binding Zn-ribbon protein involved in translation (DUF1610 family)
MGRKPGSKVQKCDDCGKRVVFAPGETVKPCPECKKEVKLDAE